MVMVHFLNHSLCNTRSNAPHLHPADSRLSRGEVGVDISFTSLQELLDYIFDFAMSRNKTAVCGYFSSFVLLRSPCKEYLDVSC